MIRPLTIVTFVMACGSGLYLYQSKHEVQVLDRTIERTVHDINALREQSHLLAVEWTMLNDPERLRQFSDTYLNLKAINPPQFASLGDLNNRLPLPRAEAPAHGAGEQEGTSVETETTAQPMPVPEPDQGIAAEEVMPVPPIPIMHPIVAVASVARPSVDSRVAEAKVQAPRPQAIENPPRPVVVADARPTAQHVVEQRAVPRVADRVEVKAPAAPPRPVVIAASRPMSVPAYAQPVAAPVSVPAPAPAHPDMGSSSGPYAGSLLGMARGAAPAMPRPTPVSAHYNAN